ncbi:DUF6524 family protein [Pseudooceanicola aestuarii]|uniref:DUF6524 family protein n=1 Tax=Pseudooceanicola aestuarii TaxID=2697319 RepID=UPI0013CF5FD1|nr:DUF6524 family protein [Pseudooceanicola aestuarii]
MGFFVRWVAAFVLLALTFNPTQWNYVRWSSQHWEEQMPLALLFGLLLFVAYLIYLRATLRSIGLFGMGLVLAITGALLWVLYDYGILDLGNRNQNVWLGIFALSLVLGIGLSWSLIRRRLSGQVDIDDVDEE